MIAGIANLARRRPVGAMPNGLPAFVFAVEELDERHELVTLGKLLTQRPLENVVDHDGMLQ